MSSARRCQSGFTLIELTVGLAILGLMMVAILSALRLGTQTWRTADRDAAGRAEIAAVQDVLRHAIADADPAFASPVLSDHRIAFDGSDDALALISPLPDAIASGVRAQQHFFLVRDGQSHDLVLGWRLDLPSSDGGLLPENRAVLLDRVAQIRFAYFGVTEGAEAAAWTPDWSGQSRLPELVRVSVTRDDPGMPRWPDLIAAPRANATMDCPADPVAPTCQRVQ